VAVEVAILIGAGVRFAHGEMGDDSRKGMIQQSVAELEEQTMLPQQVDEITTFEDVTTESWAIHYYYTIVGADTTGLAEDALADSIPPTLCSTEETKGLLD